MQVIQLELRLIRVVGDWLSETETGKMTENVIQEFVY